MKKKKAKDKVRRKAEKKARKKRRPEPLRELAQNLLTQGFKRGLQSLAPNIPLNFWFPPLGNL